MRTRLVWVAAAGLIALTAGARATDYLYWTDSGGGAVGRSAYDGTGANLSFVFPTTPRIGIAVGPKYIYWSTSVHKIARAKLDGTGLNASFISTSGGPYGLAIDSKYIYWVDSGGSIGRAKLDGTGVNLSFMTGLLGAYDIAVLNGFIYLSGYDNIVRAKIDGTGVNTSFITGLNEPYGVTVYGNYIYWTDKGNNAIGRAKLDGSGVDQSFVTGASGPFGIAVGGGYLFWANNDTYAGTTIGRADLAGTSVDQSFLTVGNPVGVATTFDIPPQTVITVMPPNGTTSTSDTFEFKSNKAGTFQCSLDSVVFVACTTPKTYTGLATGGHKFKVRARDLAGKVDPTPAVYEWKIQ